MAPTWREGSPDWLFLIGWQSGPFPPCLVNGPKHSSSPASGDAPPLGPPSGSHPPLGGGEPVCLWSVSREELEEHQREGAVTWVLTCRQLKARGAFAACWGGGWESEWMLLSPWKKCPGGRVKTAFSFRAADWSILEA